MKTPLLVYTSSTFDEYLASLPKSVRYEYRKACKLGAQFQYREVPFERKFVAEWMGLWEQQTVFGKKASWQQWTPAKAEAIGVRVFSAGIAVQMAEVYDDYVYAWPVLYDKEKYPWVAKFMWFKLIEWCCENDIKYLDLDGGKGKTWRERLMTRQAGEKAGYKWKFVPKIVKENPNDAPQWIVFVCNCGWKSLSESLSESFSRCSRCAPGR